MMAFQSWHTQKKGICLRNWLTCSIRVKQTTGAGWLCPMALCQDSTIGGSFSIPLHWFLQTNPSLCASSGGKCLCVCAVRCRQKGCSLWRKTLEPPSAKCSKKNCPTKYLAEPRLETLRWLRSSHWHFGLQKWKTLRSNHSSDNQL